MRALPTMAPTSTVRPALTTGLWLILSTILLMGCSSNNVTVDSDYKAGVDFTQFKTYRWHQSSTGAKNYNGNDILDGRIRAAVDAELQAKGFRRLETGDIDFTVNYDVTTQAKTDVRSYNTYGGMAPGFSMGYGSGYYRYGYSMTYSTAPEVRTVHYEEGTFVLDVINRDNKLVWRGTAEGRLKKNLSVEEKRQSIKNVIAKVLANFPPQDAVK